MLYTPRISPKNSVITPRKLQNQRNLSETNLFKRPHKFEFYKIISTQLFTKNIYNNRACIFSKKDKIFIA